MGVIAGTLFILLFLSLLFIMLELILDSTLEISLVALLYSLSYDFSDLEMKPKKTSYYGNSNRYITISGIRSKRYGYEINSMDISVSYKHNRFIFNSFKNNRLNLRSRSLIAVKLVSYEQEMRSEKFNELFNDLEIKG